MLPMQKESGVFSATTLLVGIFLAVALIFASIISLPCVDEDPLFGEGFQVFSMTVLQKVFTTKMKHLRPTA